MRCSHQLHLFTQLDKQFSNTIKNDIAYSIMHNNYLFNLFEYYKLHLTNSSINYTFDVDKF